MVTNHPPKKWWLTADSSTLDHTAPLSDGTRGVRMLIGHSAVVPGAMLMMPMILCIITVQTANSCSSEPLCFGTQVLWPS